MTGVPLHKSLLPLPIQNAGNSGTVDDTSCLAVAVKPKAVTPSSMSIQHGGGTVHSKQVLLAQTRPANVQPFRVVNSTPAKLNEVIGQATKTCVMCGIKCQYLCKKRDRKDDLPFIMRNNKGVCNVCQDVIWVVADSKLEIRFCDKCKDFHPWAAFQGRGSRIVKNCHGCRCRAKNKKHAPLSSGTDTAFNAIASTSAIRCVLLAQPVGEILFDLQRAGLVCFIDMFLTTCRSYYSSTLEATNDSPLPSFDQIVNYPAFIRKLPDKNGNKCCVMCSKLLPYPLRSNQNGFQHFICRQQDHLHCLREGSLASDRNWKSNQMVSC